nr:unnamed protein product [Digitaria exilis]
MSCFLAIHPPILFLCGITISPWHFLPPPLSVKPRPSVPRELRAAIRRRWSPARLLIPGRIMVSSLGSHLAMARQTAAAHCRQSPPRPRPRPHRGSPPIASCHRCPNRITNPFIEFAMTQACSRILNRAKPCTLAPRRHGTAAILVTGHPSVSPFNVTIRSSLAPPVEPAPPSPVVVGQEEPQEEVPQESVEREEELKEEPAHTQSLLWSLQFWWPLQRRDVGSVRVFNQTGLYWMKNSSNEARCFPRLLEKVLMVLGIFVCPLYFTNRAVDPCCDDYYVSRVHSREKKEGEEGYYTRSMHDADTPLSTAARRALRSICYDYQEQLRYRVLLYELLREPEPSQARSVVPSVPES